jgi:hypothetical protein
MLLVQATMLFVGVRCVEFLLLHYKVRQAGRLERLTHQTLSGSLDAETQQVANRDLVAQNLLSLGYSFSLLKLCSAITANGGGLLLCWYFIIVSLATKAD